jgi:flagellar M-ring protein FliF
MMNDQCDSSFDIREFVIRKGPRMDFINKALTQLSELFRSMTPGARLTAGLLLAVVVVSMGYLFRQSAAGPDAYLFGGEPLTQGQLTAVEAAIAKAGLSGYAREGNRIRVPTGQQAAYLAAVADEGALPPNFNTILEKALDKGGPWESSAATRERLKIAKQQTLSEIVRAMYWVENAVVLYDEHESRSLRELSSNKQVTASVSVKPISGETLTLPRAKNIQKLIAGAVNMQPGDVTITNLGEGGAYGSEGEITPDIFPDGSLLQTKFAFDSQTREKIVKALGDIPGVRVSVNADFDNTLQETTDTVKPDPKTATSRETSTEEKSSQTSGDGGGRPGVTANGPNRQGANQPPVPQNQNETTNKTSEIESVVGITKNSTLKRDYAVKEVWATVTVPSSYIESIWKARNPTAPPKPDDLKPIETQVIRNVEEIVEPLLTLQINKGQNQYKHIKVVVLDSLPVPTIAPPSMVNTATSWIGRYWSTLAMLGMAMFSLLVLRSVVNGKPSATGITPSASAPALVLHDEEPPASGEAEGETEAERPRLKLKRSKSLKDDLVEIVKEDPDTAADILRSWIAKAG